MRIGVLPSFPNWWWSLTPDEQRVQLVSQGLMNREIAEDLNVTEQAIKDQLPVIFRKTGCNNRLELALTMMRDA